jgi:hypothetical protein
MPYLRGKQWIIRKNNFPYAITPNWNKDGNQGSHRPTKLWGKNEKAAIIAVRKYCQLSMHQLAKFFDRSPSVIQSVISTAKAHDSTFRDVDSRKLPRKSILSGCRTRWLKVWSERNSWWAFRDGLAPMPTTATKKFPTLHSEVLQNTTRRTLPIGTKAHNIVMTWIHLFGATLTLTQEAEDEPP